MIHNCPACGTANDAWRPFCTKCSLRLDGARLGPPGMAGSALERYRPVGANDSGAFAGPASPAPRGRARAAGVVAALALVAGAVVGGIAFRRHEAHVGPAADPPPAHWDGRLAPLAQAAQRLRGLTFEHPVSARFYDDATFDRLATRNLDSALALRSLTQAASEMRALGIAGPTTNLAAAERTLVASTALAFYDPRTKRISVRGTQLDAAHDVTIVHELTRALDDQYFDLEAIRRKADDSDGDAVTALVEGDARDVEDRYVDSLSGELRAQYQAEERRLQPSNAMPPAGVPDALVLSTEAPDDLGEQFVRALRTSGGVDAVNRAFRDPPGSDWYVVDPAAYLDHEQVQRVARPQLPTSSRLIADRGETGSLTLYLVLAERIDAHDALAASDAWRGDHTVLYSDGSQTCVADDIVASDQAARATLQRALLAWQHRMPPRDVSVRALGTRGVALRACDAGAAAPRPTHQMVAAYALPLTRARVLATFLGNGNRPDAAWCTADQVVYAYSPADLSDPAGRAFATLQFAERLRGWMQACEASSPSS